MLQSVLFLLLAASGVHAWLPFRLNFDWPDLLPAHWRYLAEDGHSKRWLPGTTPIRGVNLGSMYIMEPWMSSQEWTNVIGCDPSQQPSEFDCVMHLGQATANTNFQNHWRSWITQEDFAKMASYGLNTIRIPLGCWIYPELKYSSEHFPEGQWDTLSSICGWAADQGMYIILDLHGAPYAQVGHDADTGQMVADPTPSNPDFYQSSQYQRAYWFLGNITQYVHQNSGPSGSMRNVGMLEILNEPAQGNPVTQSMRDTYYPGAFNAIRAVEHSLGVGSNNFLHIQMMNAKWGAGDPTQYLTDNYFAAYDDHRYIGFDGSVPTTQAGYMSATCHDDRGGNWPTVVGEWSLHVADGAQFDSQFWPVANNLAFYKNWFAAQMQVYERQQGWIFWSWKTRGLGDPRWDYQAAVAAGIIPTDLNSIASTTPCAGY